VTMAIAANPGLFRQTRRANRISLGMVGIGDYRRCIHTTSKSLIPLTGLAPGVRLWDPVSQARAGG
jgi:hypothetical protein